MRLLSVGGLILVTLIYLGDLSLWKTDASALHGSSAAVKFQQTTGDALGSEGLTIPKADSLSNAGSVLKADSTAKTGSIPKKRSILKAELTPKTNSLSNAASVPKAVSVQKIVSIPKTGSILKSHSVSKAHSVSKSKSVPEADTTSEARATHELSFVPTVDSMAAKESALLFESHRNSNNDELEHNTIGRPNQIDNSPNPFRGHTPGHESDAFRRDEVCNEKACSGSICYPGLSAKNGIEDLDFEERSASDSRGMLSSTESQKEFDMYNCTWICSGSGVNCSSRKFLSVPQRLPKTIKVLLLSKNNIEVIQPCAFCGYPNLTALYLDGNRLQNLSERSFQNLGRLQHLSLKDNFLEMKTGTYPKNVFSDLKSLKMLAINKNTQCTMCPEMNYPDQALSVLSNLEDLRIDGLFNKSFGAGFKNLKAVTNIEMGGHEDGYCTLHMLTNRTFENVPTVTRLSMRWCSIYGDLVQAGTFKPLKSLETLILYGNYYLKFKNLQVLMWGLKDSNLQHLDLGRIESMFLPSITVSYDMIKNLPRSLKSLRCNDNGIEILEKSVLSNLPKGLTYIDASGNSFVYSSYLRNLSKLENLETLLLNGRSTLTSLPRYLPKGSNSNFPPVHEQDLGSSRRQLRHERSLGSNHEEYQLSLPPRLLSISFGYADLKLRLTRFSINPNNTLRYLSMWANYFPYALGPISGLNNVTHINMNRSFISYLHPSFFQEFPELTHLDLNTNFLRDTYTKGSEVRLFENLTKLEYLNLSINLIEQLPDNAFAGANNLQYLDLSQNSIGEFHQNLWNMSQLKYLSLRQTSIRHLHSDLTQFFDTFGPNLTLDLSRCPIRCTCDNLNFIRWMMNSPAFKSFEGYECIYKDGSQKNIFDGYQGIFMLLERECISNFPLFLWVLALTILLLCVIIGVLVYRFRWKIRYFYYAAYILCKDREKTEEEAFEFDVFISYASPDEQFVVRTVVPELTKREVKPHVHGLHFTAGNYIASNIVSAIKKSRKTLVILTEQMLDSYWCTYELQMANLESVYSGRRVLVFLLKDSIPRSRLGMDFLYHIQNNTYMPYPNTGSQRINPEVTTAFWDKMARDLLNS